jgi:hypothetical protein
MWLCARIILYPLAEGEPISALTFTRLMRYRDGHYGLFLDDVLQDGSSAPCPTFANEILCTGETPAGSSSKSLDFECVGVEVWAIGT